MDSTSTQTIANQDGQGASANASVTHASTKVGSNDPNGSSEGEVASAATHTDGDQEEPKEHTYDDILEAEFILHLQAVAVELSQNYKSSKGRVLLASLSKFQRLVDERRMVLSEYDSPVGPDAELNALEFAEAQMFTVAVNRLATRMMASFDVKDGRVPRAVIKGLERMTTARGEILEEEREE